MSTAAAGMAAARAPAAARGARIARRGRFAASRATSRRRNATAVDAAGPGMAAPAPLDDGDGATPPDAVGEAVAPETVAPPASHQTNLAAMDRLYPEEATATAAAIHTVDTAGPAGGQLYPYDETEPLVATPAAQVYPYGNSGPIAPQTGVETALGATDEATLAYDPLQLSADGARSDAEGYDPLGVQGGGIAPRELSTLEVTLPPPERPLPELDLGAALVSDSPAADEAGAAGAEGDGRLTVALGAAAAIACVGSWLFGYFGACINIPLSCIGNTFGLCANTLPLFVVTMNDFGGLWGAVCAGTAAEALGRSGALRLSLLICASGAALCGTATDVGVFAAGRLMTGLGSGLASMLVPLYVGELAPPSMRARLAVTSRAAFVIGQVSALSAGTLIKSAAHNGAQAMALGSLEMFWWRPIFMLAAGLAASSLAMSSLGTTPETAQWLARRGRIAAAARTLRQTRGVSHIDADNEARACAEAESSATAGSTTLVDILRNPKYRRLVLTGIGLSAFQALSGANSLVFFTATIFKDVGVAAPELAALATGAANLLGCITALFLTERLGRRALLMGSFGGMALSMGALAVASTVGAPLVAVAVAPLALFFFACGAGPLPYLMFTELFPAKIRATAASACTAANWLGVSVVGRNFLPLMTACGVSGAFTVLSCVCLAATSYVFAFVPETKGA